MLAELRKLPNAQFFVGYQLGEDARSVTVQGLCKLPVPQADGSMRFLPWLRFRIVKDQRLPAMLPSPTLDAFRLQPLEWTW